MFKKKQLLFVIESLALAGSEKSLIALLCNIDSDLYDIDLQMFQYGGELEKFLPQTVNVLPALPYTQYLNKSDKDDTGKAFKKDKLTFIFAKVKYSILLRLRQRNHSEIAKLFWETSKSAFSNLNKKYDVAIAFAQGVPTFYVMDKVEAEKKITWVNANMQFTKHNIKYQHFYYNKYDAIVCVTEGNKQHMESIFPDLKIKYEVISDIIDYNYIKRRSEEASFSMPANRYNILTVSRLDNGMKGMDIALNVCKLLRDRNLKFHWYFIGKGRFRGEMERFFNEHGLNEYITFVGTTDNPYPYYKSADLYVQTSRSESFGMSIAEARLLNLPVVTTRFDTVFGQMVAGKNGLVTDINAQAVANAIERIMLDQDLYNSIKNFLENEKKENNQSVKKFEGLIDKLFVTSY